MLGELPERWRMGLTVDEHGVCTNLRQDNTCAIYAERPDVCRIDVMRPARLTTERWYRVNLATCDDLHRRVYGTPRIPMVA